MPEQDLDGPQVGAGLKQVGGEAVPQGVCTVTCLPSPAACDRARRQIRVTVRMLIGRSGSRPGNSQVRGRAAFQYRRSRSSNRDESMT